MCCYERAKFPNSMMTMDEYPLSIFFCLFYPPLNMKGRVSNMSEAIISRRGWTSEGKPQLITQTFTSNIIYNLPKNIRGNISIFLVGGGEGGTPNRGGGGGFINNAELEIPGGTQVQITVGVGGNGWYDDRGGNAGGTSSFGTYLSANGAGGTERYSGYGHNNSIGGTGKVGGGGGGYMGGGDGGTYGGGGGGGVWRGRGSGGDGGTYGGGGGGGAGARGDYVYAGDGGNGGQYGGGGGGGSIFAYIRTSSPYSMANVGNGGIGGEYGGNGGEGSTTNNLDTGAEAGTNTLSISNIEFKGAGLAGSIGRGRYCGGAGGGGYGGNGGAGRGVDYDNSTGTRWYGGGGAGGGGYGSNGGVGCYFI